MMEKKGVKGREKEEWEIEREWKREEEEEEEEESCLNMKEYKE